MQDETSEYLASLVPFGAGHRACIGRNIAMINILKVTATLFRLYEFDPVKKDEELVMRHIGIAEKSGGLFCRVRKRV